MTRQEAVDLLNKFEFCCNFSECTNDWGCEECCEALNMAIKALEQEPSEDAVSRKALLDKAYAYGNGLEPEGYCVDVEDIKAIPSVAPTRKKGKWINREHCQVDEDAYEVATCSNCKAEITLEYPYDSFCPNCGKRMESEE